MEKERKSKREAKIGGGGGRDRRVEKRKKMEREDRMENGREREK